MSKSQRITAVAAGGAVILIIAVAAWALWPRGTTEVTRDDAIAQFRERQSADDARDDGPGGSDTADPDTTDPDMTDTGTGDPASGVYTYAASGGETVTLGPLPAETRQLPATVTATVSGVGDGCFEWSVSFFAEHTEDTRYCRDGNGLRIDEHTKHQRIGALSPTAAMSCDAGVLPTNAGDATTLECTLVLSGGPASITATLAGTATAAEVDSIEIGGETVETTLVEVDWVVSGDLQGSWQERTWFSRDHLAVRIERDLDLSGPATLTENSELELTSTEPTT